MSTPIDSHLTEKKNNFFDNSPKVIGHPAGLFVLFFTEMWERFSYYGMRGLLVLFLVSGLQDGGWAWEREDALKLYGYYTGLVYVTPILGGLLADVWLGYRRAVMVGAVLMTLGHASMALETEATFYAGLVLLILGNGAFKPNISSMVGGLYPKNSEKRDAGYTIFYMGINAGAFLGILLCGYIGETVGWSYGFGLAGIFMFFGLLQFGFGQKIFGNIGLSPKKAKEIAVAEGTPKDDTPANVVASRIAVILIFSVFTIFFWMAFEQAGGSMTIFAADYTDRVLAGSQGTVFKVVNAVLTIGSVAIVSWVLILLAIRIAGKYPLTILFTSISFVIIWGIAIWMLIRQFNDNAPEVPASWFGVLNSFFIIALAPLFSKLWEKYFNPPGPVKFGMGLILLGIGFAVLAYGAMGIPQGAQTASVSMVWLILAYLFHTVGELCLSPVGLSYVSKLAPARLVGMMFGFWFLASAIANMLAGLSGSLIDEITSKYSMSSFFLIFAALPVGAGLLIMALTPLLRKMMHGIR